jgi:phosphoribosylanthranilate isomerase
MMVKICGITNREDALAAVAEGASALGFNFYPQSPRFVTPAQAAAIAAEIPDGILKVGVFVNESPERVAESVALAGLDVAQLHGEEDPAAYPKGLRIWKALRVGADFDPAGAAALPAEALLLDGPAGALYGGSGESFDWSRAAGLTQRVIIAGGLDASNVRRAIEIARPWGVDACSRIERQPGLKDHAKMAAFLQAARAA